MMYLGLGAPFKTWITLKASIGMFRESKNESAHNFDPKGVFKGEPSNLGCEDPPPLYL